MKLKRKISQKRCVIDLIIIATLLVIFYSCNNSIIFRPPPCSYQSSEGLVTIDVENDESIAAFYLPKSDEAFVIFHSHGNGEDMGHLRDYLQCFKLKDFGVLAYDYRGYGLSDGVPSEMNTYKDIESAYQFLVHQENVDPKRIIVHGRSVGSVPSVWLAEKYPVGGLVLVSPFVSAYRTRTHWPILPFDKYNNLSRIKNIDCPLLIIHGQKDRIVGFWHGKKLYETANEPKMHYWIPEAGHNDLLGDAWNEYWKVLDEFREMINQSQSERFPDVN